MIAVLVEGAPWWPTGTYPPFFATPRFLLFDAYLVIAALASSAWASSSRRVRASRALGSRYPRTDASGALTLGLVLGLTSGAILLTRLLAVIRGG